MNLHEIRLKIDVLDEKIVNLLAERAALVSEAARLKKYEMAVRDPRRVEEVINRVRALAERAGLPADIAARTYRTMIGCFIERELIEFSADKEAAASFKNPHLG